MKIIGRPRLLDFMRLHGETSGALQSWVREAEVAIWASAADIEQRYHRAQILPSGLVVFPLVGNQYHLKVQVNFSARVLLIVEVCACYREQLPLRITVPGGRPATFQGGQHEH